MMIKRLVSVCLAAAFTITVPPVQAYAAVSSRASVYEKITSLGYIYRDKIAEAVGLASLGANAINVEDMVIASVEDLIFAMNQKARMLELSYGLTMSSSYDFEETISKFNHLYFEGIEAVSYSYKKSSNAVYSVNLDVRYFDFYSVLRAYKNPSLEAKLSDKELVLLSKAKSIVSDIIRSEMTEYERVLAVHDYLVLNGRYDTLEVGSIPRDSFGVYGILIDGVGVCDSYSKSMALLLNMAGVECIKVSGRAQNPGQSEVVGHSWNKVKIGGMWYNVDVTWDDPVPDQEGRISYAYFNITDDVMARDHSWNTDEGVYPTAYDTTYNYFVYNGLVANNYKQFVEKLSDGIETLIQYGTKQVDIYVTNYDHQSYDLSFISKFGIRSVKYSRPEGAEGVFSLILAE